MEAGIAQSDHNEEMESSELKSGQIAEHPTQDQEPTLNSYVPTIEGGVVVAVCVTGFHHIRGNEVEWIYPEEHSLSSAYLYVFINHRLTRIGTKWQYFPCLTKLICVTKIIVSFELESIFVLPAFNR